VGVLSYQVKQSGKDYEVFLFSIFHLSLTGAAGNELANEKWQMTND
jgi:hypothetical protein